jgi:AmmeMemoRadiSam system protein B
MIIIAAADLSHIGPAFGGHPVDLLARARLEAADRVLMDRICDGDEQGFFEAIKQVGDRNNVCGAAPIYLTLRLLSPIKGKVVAYDRCPADAQGLSLVSICGITLQRSGDKS